MTTSIQSRFQISIKLASFKSAEGANKAPFICSKIMSANYMNKIDLNCIKYNQLKEKQISA